MNIEDITNKVFLGDCRTLMKEFPDDAVQACITSPPYWNCRDYKNESQMGMEVSIEGYIKELADVMDEVKRVLRPDGSLWINVGDCWTGNNIIRSDGRRGFIKSKKIINVKRDIEGLSNGNRVGVPWRVAFELQKRGWILRLEIIWAKPNPMPEPPMNRPTVAHEYVFLLAKTNKYFYNADAVKEKANEGSKYETRNKNSVWNVRSASFKGAHIATFPQELIIPMVLAGTPDSLSSIVLDPFMGSGTTAIVAKRLGRSYTGVELSKEYLKIINNRLSQQELF